ncbi:DUF4352 domain-containing protein [Nocardia huaxiensis]|uniref:DUF4352 domain-containing protein n=1 Tax=Nocardia huaxiensis TaxID=2755382 RepID=A0A7D6VI68_9NOCA|nr:DUF4352 domain-containing protein [Nocardia huaxiensis]QLY33497.1 DUF4352 domain-containing protein [Nocardia huaxiensis]
MTYQPGPQNYPTPPVPPQYLPPAPPKKSNALKIILIAFAAIIVLCGGCTALISKSDPASKGTTSETGSPATDSPAKESPATKPIPGLNTPVRDGKFEFVVTEIQSGIPEVGDNPYLAKKAQGAYTIVSLTITNTSDKPYGFSPGNQYVFDTKNRKFSNDASAGMNLQADTSLYADLNPGNTITAQIVFDLPADSQPDYIMLHDSMFSGGVKVSLH